MPVQQTSQATVEAILEGTARTLTKRGYAGTTTNHIAREAGVGIGSFYEYFADKDVAVAAVVDRFAKRVFAHAVSKAPVAMEKSQPEAVRYFVGEMIDLFAADAALVRTLYQQVPFVWEMPTVQGLVGQLERLGLELADVRGSNVPLIKVQDRFYVLGIAVGAAIVQIATDPSVIGRRKALADELSLMISRYLRLVARN